MKKNNMLRLASVLLVAVLLSTCAISGVFANYFTDGTTKDVAQVAKWGVVITADVENDDADLFYPTYDFGKTGTDTTVERAASASVDFDRVAPGTEISTWTPFTVTGTPEVDVKVTYTATVELANWADADGYYCPVVFTVNEGTAEEAIIDGNTCTDMNDLAGKIKAAIEANSNARYEANTDLSTVKAPTISWVWAFGDNDEATKVSDTYLGDKANATISIQIDVEVEQLD